ncbi:MAG: integrin alpha [Limisphaerales bacterium]
MPKLRTHLLSTFIVFWFSSFASASESFPFLLFQKNGIVGDVLGYSISGIGDINSDGKADFIVGAMLASPSGVHYAGSVFVYSGADGSILFQKNGPASSEMLGHSVAGVGDVNGDGINDFIVSSIGPSPRPGTVYVYSGADGALLFQKVGATPDAQLGYSVSGAGDINGDGYADIIAGARLGDTDSLNDVGSAFVYSGKDGSLLFQKNGNTSNANFGQAVAGLGDINGDGKSDFVVGAS